MNFDQLTIKAQEVLRETIQTARQEGHPEVTPEQLALSLVEQQDGTVPAILERVGVSPGTVAQELRTELARLPRVSGEAHEPRMSPQLNRILDAADKVAREFKDDYIAAEQLLLALVRDGK